MVSAEGPAGFPFGPFFSCRLLLFQARFFKEIRSRRKSRLDPLAGSDNDSLAEGIGNISSGEEAGTGGRTVRPYDDLLFFIQDHKVCHRGRVWIMTNSNEGPTDGKGTWRSPGYFFYFNRSQRIFTAKPQRSVAFVYGKVRQYLHSLDNCRVGPQLRPGNEVNPISQGLKVFNDLQSAVATSDNGHFLPFCKREIGNVSVEYASPLKLLLPGDTEFLTCHAGCNQDGSCPKSFLSPGDDAEDIFPGNDPGYLIHQVSDKVGMKQLILKTGDQLSRTPCSFQFWCYQPPDRPGP